MEITSKIIIRNFPRKFFLPGLLTLIEVINKPTCMANVTNNVEKLNKSPKNNSTPA